MSDLISREALLDTIRRKMFDTRYDIELAMDVIKTTPAVDVVYVVHGEWIEKPDATHFCSECGKDALWEQYDEYCFHEKLTDICPNCGAKNEGSKHV